VHPAIAHLDREDGEITDEHIKDIERPVHRFWPAKEEEKTPKRKREESEDDPVLKRQRVEVAGRLAAQATLEHLDRTLGQLEERF
jgi:hypothetical protein